MCCSTDAELLGGMLRRCASWRRVSHIYNFFFIRSELENRLQMLLCD